MFLHGNPPHLWIPYELISLVNTMDREIGDCELQHQIMMRIEKDIEPIIIEQSLIKRDVYFEYDGVNNKIKVLKCKPIDKVSMPDGIAFCLEAKRQNITVL